MSYGLEFKIFLDLDGTVYDKLNGMWEEISARVLSLLGIEDLFEGKLDVWEMTYIPKPDRRTYERAMQLAGVSDPAACIFVDDTLKNLKPAREMGWHSVWVDSFKSDPSAEYSIAVLKYLSEVIADVEAENWMFPIELLQPQFADYKY